MDLAALQSRLEDAGVTSGPPPVIPGSVLITDGDALAYRLGAAKDSGAAAIARCGPFLEGVRERHGAAIVRVLLTASASHKRHRYSIATVKAYQAQRKTEKPQFWAAVREHLEERPIAKLTTDREADDAMACMAGALWEAGRVPIIYSVDKDLRMVPALHIDWISEEETWVTPGTWKVVREDGKVFGRAWFYYQLLHGDTVDNIPGIPKCGPKKAEALMEGIDTESEAVEVARSAYQDHYGDEWADRLVEQAALLWLSTDIRATEWAPKELLQSSDELRAAMRRLKERACAS